LSIVGIGKVQKNGVLVNGGRSFSQVIMPTFVTSGPVEENKEVLEKKKKMNK